MRNNPDDLTLKPFSTAPKLRGLELISFFLNMKPDFLGYFLKLQKKYGDLVRIDKAIIIFNKDLFFKVLKTDYKNFEKGTKYQTFKPLFGEGIFTSEGQKWKKHRVIVSKELQLDSIGNYHQIIISLTNQFISAWDKKLNLLNQKKIKVDISEEMMALTFQIMSKALFGKDLEGVANKAMFALHFSSKFLSKRMYSFIPFPLYFPLPSHIKFNRHIKFLDGLVQEIINSNKGDTKNENSVIHKLLNPQNGETENILSNKEIRDEVLTLLLAGHETTGIALIWTLYLLAKNPEYLDKVIDEINNVIRGDTPSFEELNSLKVLKMVFYESIRLFPPAALISRRALKDTSLNGYFIPKDTTILCPIYCLHRNPDYWENPDKFNPDRFNESDQKIFNTFPYLPFGIGPRTCVGKDFAIYESLAILSLLLKNFSFSLVDNHLPKPIANISLEPKNCLHLYIHKKR